MVWGCSLSVGFVFFFFFIFFSVNIVVFHGFDLGNSALLNEKIADFGSMFFQEFVLIVSVSSPNFYSEALIVLGSSIDESDSSQILADLERVTNDGDDEIFVDVLGTLFRDVFVD